MHLSQLANQEIAQKLQCYGTSVKEKIPRARHFHLQGITESLTEAKLKSEEISVRNCHLPLQSSKSPLSTYDVLPAACHAIRTLSSSFCANFTALMIKL